MENQSPVIIPKAVLVREALPALEELKQEHFSEEIDVLEVFELVRNLKDPEHPLSLEELGVIAADFIKVDAVKRVVDLRFVPTIPHCSQATLIGLMFRCVLMWSLPRGWHSVVRISPGSHASEASINKQLADKERVMAALENVNVLGMICRGVGHSRSLESALKNCVDVNGDVGTSFSWDEIKENIDVLMTY